MPLATIVVLAAVLAIARRGSQLTQVHRTPIDGHPVARERDRLGLGGAWRAAAVVVATGRAAGRGLPRVADRRLERADPTCSDRLDPGDLHALLAT